MAFAMFDVRRQILPSKFDPHALRVRLAESRSHIEN